MKKIFLSVRALCSAGFATLISSLGLSGCNLTDVNNGMAEYGTPTVKYQFKVKVVDQTNAPVEGLEVQVQGDGKQLTDATGTATLTGEYAGPRKEHEVTFAVKDVDGEKNGIVSDLSQTETIAEKDFVSQGNGGWDSGVVRKDINIKVERK